MRRMHRYEVPVDDQKHLFKLTSDPRKVAAKVERWLDTEAHAVEFWAENDSNGTVYSRAFQVFGTGQPLPDGAAWIGTCDRTAGLVWHLYEVAP